jgi:nicotinate-nucleotide--dimethylbenzimidazole phosphoribosyltransferase
MFTQELQHIIDYKTKPLGSLGMLEDLAKQIGTVLKSTTPELNRPHLVVFAADHGIALEGVSAYPQAVTYQMVLNFLQGGAAINVFCRQHGIQLQVVDAGVNADFESSVPLGKAKIAHGTASFLHGPAMSASDLELCFQHSEEMMQQIAGTGCNVIGFGEMGIGNTSSAAVLMSLICKLPLSDCIGRGTGLDDQQLVRKQEILDQAIHNYQGNLTVNELLAYFGGFEIAQLTGAFIAAAKRDMLILVDGFIATAAYLCALKIDPSIARTAIFCHQSDEKGHQALLNYLGARPLLQLGLRLGEGTGCALAYPLLCSAVAFLKEMASFESAAVSNRL